MLQCVQRGNFFAAGNAVGGPEIQQHDLALKLVKTKRLTCERLKLDIRRHFEVCVCGCGFFNWDWFLCPEPAVQQTFRIRNEGHEFRAGQQSRLSTHHQQSYHNQHNARNNLNLVQVPAEVLVETQKLIYAETRQEKRHREASRVKRRKHETAAPAAACCCESDDAAEYWTNAGSPACRECHTESSRTENAARFIV